MRLYSPRDVTLVRRAAVLAAEGINLTGIRRILALEAQVSALQALIAGREGAGRLSGVTAGDNADG